MLSRLQNTLNQVLPTYGSAAVVPRGFVHFLDPLLSGTARFAQKSGYPLPILSPQIRTNLAQRLYAGQFEVLLENTRLLPWLRQGEIVSIDGTELFVVSDAVEIAGGQLRVVFTTQAVTSHSTPAFLRIEQFSVFASPITSGSGTPFSPPLEITSSFIVVPGDVVVVANRQYPLTSATQTGVDGDGNGIYDVKTSVAEGFPAFTGGGTIYIVAKPAYRSELLSLPQASSSFLPTVDGPFAYDWVSGPLNDGYFPSPESRVWVQTFNAASIPLSDQREIGKNDVESRVAIQRDQLLFWQLVEGGLNWNGSFTELKAFDDGDVHLWTPCVPTIDPAPRVTKSSVVPGFIPHLVVLLPNNIAGEIEVVETLNKTTIPRVVNLAGTVTATNGLTTVTGVGTAFLTDLGVGDYVRIGADTAVFEVQTITNNLTLDLTVAYTQPTQAGVAIERQNYTFDAVLGTVRFADAYAGLGVTITYRPQLDWSVQVRTSEPDIEVSFVIGNTPRQTFNVAVANTVTTLALTTATSAEIDAIHITARRASGAAGPFTVEIGDFQQRGSRMTSVQYSMLTGADLDYAWASSGMLLKPLWPSLNLLRGRLDGQGALARALDAGFLLVQS